MKKIVAILLASLMIAGMAISAVFAQTVTYSGTPAGSGSITILNAAKGETYSIYKVFDATRGTSGAIAYTYAGTEIPAELAEYFEFIYSGSNYVQVKSGTTTLDNTSGSTLAAWVGKQKALLSAESDGSALKFANLPYGYYIVTTTQGEQLLSVTSTDPDAEIYDKNTTEITVEKTVSGTSFSIGQTIPYTATFNTTNYVGTEQVNKYIITDTLPEFLSNVQITSLKIIEPKANPDGTDKVNDLSDSYKSFGSAKQITIPWVDDEGSGSYKSKYTNGSIIEIKYTGVLTKVVKFDGEGNKNTVSINPYSNPSSGTSGSPISGSWHDDAIVYTYGAALKKVDENHKTLAGAEFQIAGLEATEIGSGSGLYVVVSTSGTTTTTLKVNASGTLYLLGLASGSYSILETKAPDGYNKLEDPATLTTTPLGSVYTEVSGTWYEDENGNRTENSGSHVAVTSGSYTDLEPFAVEVVNNKGQLLPSTGGIGTTIFYIVGGLMAVSAGVVLVSRKRMGKEDN